jgi:hypothetical protein
MHRESLKETTEPRELVTIRQAGYTFCTLPDQKVLREKYKAQTPLKWLKCNCVVTGGRGGSSVMIQKGCPRREAKDTFQSASGLGARGERRERQKKKQRE